MKAIQTIKAPAQGNISLITPGAQHVEDMGRICFDAFRVVHDRHGFPRDFRDLNSAVHVVSLIRGLKNVYAVAAADGDRIVGSNFLLTTDKVGGVGPISIHPEWQGNGIGRQLMQAVLEHAKGIGMDQVRLLQDSFNTASFSLYASLGFDARDPIGVMRAPVADSPDGGVRLAVGDDLESLASLCREIYRADRKGEMAEWSRLGIPTLVREVGGQIRGYLIPGMLGHGIAESESDALALIRHLSLFSPPGMDLFFLPLRHTAFYRAALSCGARLIKIMTLMSWGRYEEPNGTWMPSVLY